MVQFIGLTRSAFKSIAKTVRTTDARLPSCPKVRRRISGPSGAIEFEGTLNGVLAAPATGLTDATTVLCTRWEVIPGDTHTPRHMQATSKADNVVNRNPLITAIAGAYARWRQIVLSDGSLEFQFVEIKKKTTVVTSVTCSGGVQTVTDADITG